MTKVKLVNGTVINASDVIFKNGSLNITTADHTVEELAKIFSDKSNLSHIVLLTENGIESGYKDGFTSYAGIKYNTDGTKTVELFQPKDVTEARISKIENTANGVKEAAKNTHDKVQKLEESNSTMLETIDSILTEVIPSLLG